MGSKSLHIFCQPLVKIAEKFTPEGDSMHEKLGVEFDQKYRTEADKMPDLHD